MINRVLIRIKVVQILYSYLLVEKKFTLEEPPVTPTREKRYAYGLYVEVLAMLVLISERISRRGGIKPLLSTRFIYRVQEDEHVQNALNRARITGNLDRIADELAETVKNSGLYKLYLKDSDHSVDGAEETFWRSLFTHIIMPSPSIRKYAESLDGYTLKGLERMETMMNSTLSNFMESQDTLSEGTDTLEKSLEQSRELYFRLLALADDLTELQSRQIYAARHKHLRTAEDENPNMRFVENRAIVALRKDETYRNYIEKNHINWLTEDPLLANRMLKTITESDIYREYMESPKSGLSEDCALWRELMRKVIFVNPDFLETLEETSVFWNDDIDIMGTFVIKTFRRIEEGNMRPILDKYKDDEDAQFGRQLLQYVFKGKEEYGQWIREAVQNSEWEADRLAFMDVVVIEAALAEMLNFPQIPLSVTINEYIEIAKSYSSAKSGIFVNGLLSSLIRKLQNENILLKR